MASLFGLFKKQNSIIGLDIGSSSVKVIQLRKEKGRVILETYGELSTGPYASKAVGQAVTLAPDQLALLIKDLFKEANITTKVGAMAIPLRSSLLVTIDVPDLPEAKLAQMVPLEARKYIPVPISEVILDWSVIPDMREELIGAEEPNAPTVTDKAESEKMPKMKEVEVLIVAIHKDTIKQYEEIARLTNLEAKFLEIETFSAMRASLYGSRGAMVIVDLGAATTKVVIIDQGTVRLSHTINKGAQDVTLAIARSLNVSFAKAEEIKRKVGLVEKVGDKDLGETLSPIVEYIFNEVSQVMVEYQKKHNRSVEKVFLIGGGALLPGLFDLAKSNVYAPVVFATPFDRVDAPAFLENILQAVGPEFAVSIGLALRALEEL
ncbi:MAG: hypothetical protein A2571_02945 [Candidatus Vogelbacteria bacterium RIFOXYD1_FULL_44_32]|uniref:SHS2 domain-containing protein n=1 Tax=Candidatus Vogelbacteria bacterium RIFOXYD1_FULL_44_32 TaxID=1802438 RepID=A0A1G2QCQ9_9BACT|nr:MAG: hypothetical protein A2571_02945 [Candidatus Vogelbacteria bacterium RIFOXYD1_FULL_44_32]